MALSWPERKRLVEKYGIRIDENGVLERGDGIDGVVTIPDVVTEIGNFAFSGRKVSEITIPSTVTKIGRSAFYQCKHITNISIPDSVTELGESLFYGCSHLESVTLPEGIKVIPESTFRECKALRSIVIPNSVTKIGDDAFHGCTKIKNITIPDSVTEIGEDLFSHCSRLESVTLPEGIKIIPESAFFSCDKLRSIIIPHSVTRIEDSAFGYCSNLEVVVIPKGVIYLGKESFAGCSLLKQIVLPPTLIEIDSKAMSFSKLETIYIPTSVTKLGDSVFWLCNRALKILYEGTKEQWDQIEKGTDNDYSNYLQFNVPFDYDAQVEAITAEINKSAKKSPAKASTQKTSKSGNTTKASSQKTSNSGNTAAKVSPAKQFQKQSTPSTSTESKPAKTIQKNVATADTEVTINDDIIVKIPKGMIYSTDREEIRGESERMLVFYKDEQNEYYKNEHGDENYSFAEPYSAPQCFIMNDVASFDNDLDLSDSQILQSIYDEVLKKVFILNPNLSINAKSKSMAIYLGRCTLTDNMFGYAIVTHKGLYFGQVWLNDIENYKQRFAKVASWFDAVELVHSSEDLVVEEVSQDESQEKFVIPVLSNRRTSLGEFTLAVPEGMMTLEYSENGIDEDDLAEAKESFRLIMVPKGDYDNFENYKDVNYSLSCRNLEDNKIINFDDSVWEESEEDTKHELITLITDCCEVGDENQIHCIIVSDKLAAAFFPTREGMDNGKYWCSYGLVWFSESKMYVGTAFFNTKEDRPAFEKFLMMWLKTMKYKSQEERRQYEIEESKRYLGDFAAEDGKVDAVKITSLLAHDVVFWERDEAVLEGSHHKLTNFRFNRKMAEQYSSITNQTFWSEAVNVLLYVEQNENLIIPTRFYCPELRHIYNNEPITGLTAMQFCMDHFLEIREVTPDKYAAIMDVHLLSGIPESIKYVGELIKTLRAYNGKTSEFTYMVMLVKTMEVAGMPSSTPVSGATKDSPNTVITVKENESPFAGVIKRLK